MKHYVAYIGNNELHSEALAHYSGAFGISVLNLTSADFHFPNSPI